MNTKNTNDNFSRFYQFLPIYYEIINNKQSFKYFEMLSNEDINFYKYIWKKENNNSLIKKYICSRIIQMFDCYNVIKNEFLIQDKNEIYELIEKREKIIKKVLKLNNSKLKTNSFIKRLNFEYNLLHNHNNIIEEDLIIVKEEDKKRHKKNVTNYYIYDKNIDYMNFITNKDYNIIVEIGENIEVKGNNFIIPKLIIENDDIDTFLLDFIITTGNRYIRKDVLYFYNLLFICNGKINLLYEYEIITESFYKKYNEVISQEVTDMSMCFNIPNEYMNLNIRLNNKYKKNIIKYIFSLNTKIKLIN